MVEKDFPIDGYVMNESTEAFFKLQRQLPPGGKILFSIAYKVIGDQSQAKGKNFLVWLKDNVFPPPMWKFYNADGTPYFEKVSAPPEVKVETAAASVEVPRVEEAARGAGKNLRRQVKNQVKRGVEITPDSIIKEDYAKAEGLINACKDKSVLKKALTLSKHFSNKSEHMRHIMKRLEQV